MQPTLSINVPAPGMIYLNGRFSGEASPNAPLLAPVNAFGAVYLEYRPLEPGYFPMARKIVMSSGTPLADSLSEDVFAIRWPNAITEIELSPQEHHRETTESLSLEGIPIRITRGEHSRIEINGLTCPFPRNAATPELHRRSGAVALTGSIDSRRYILTLSPDLTRQTGFLQADRLDFESEDILRALTSKNDFAGHGILERWRLDSSGLQLISTESAWIDGTPRVPATPEETALAAVEAALLELFDEAEGFLSPALRAQHPLDSIGHSGSMCLPMKYGLPSGRNCVGLLQVESGSCAVIHPIHYQAERNGDRWLLTELAPAPPT